MSRKDAQRLQRSNASINILGGGRIASDNRQTKITAGVGSDRELLLRTTTETTKGENKEAGASRATATGDARPDSAPTADPIIVPYAWPDERVIHRLETASEAWYAIIPFAAPPDNSPRPADSITAGWRRFSRATAQLLTYGYCHWPSTGEAEAWLDAWYKYMRYNEGFVIKYIPPLPPPVPAEEPQQKRKRRAPKAESSESSSPLPLIEPRRVVRL